MVNLIYGELLKLKRSKMLPISFLGALVTPTMMIVEGVKQHYSEADITLNGFYNGCNLYTMLLFGLIVYAVIAAYLFSREYTERTLKTILTIPVSKTAFIISKFIMLFIWIMALTVVTWLGMFVLAAVYKTVFGLAGFSIIIAMRYLGKMLMGGALLFITISPFAFLALWTQGLVVPIIAVATIAMGNVALTNETLGALFPWSATFLLIDNRIVQTGYPCPLAIALIVLVSILGFLASVAYFKKEDVK